MIAKVAPTNSTVLICGETGTGKELVARALHDQSLRADMPFVPINCGALPENLIESELFGHRKGAFTGAEEHRTGLFQVANGGTLFLDEIGELPKSMQAKLLRFLESGEIRRVGDNESLICDVRVICATNRHLDQMVAAGEFREDLWFRINTFEIALPPLRERIDDILPLARHLVTRKGNAAGQRGRAVHAGDGRGLAAAHLAGQRAGAGQRRRARDDPLRSGADPPGASSAAIFRAASHARRGNAGRDCRSRARRRLPRLRRNHRRANLRQREMQAIFDASGPARRQQAQSGRRTRHQPENALQQAQSGGGTG